MSWVFFVLCAVVVLIVVSGVYVFVEACIRRKEPSWLVEEAISKTPYAKYHKCLVAADHWLHANKAQDVYVESVDGLKLHGLFVPAENAKATIILVHGYRSTKLLDFGCAFEIYHNLGYNLLVPDQRSHGESEGKLITFGVKECQDVEKWIEFHNRYLPELPVALSGLSMGASTVLFLADKTLPANVKCIVADCGFTSAWDILACVYRKVTHLPAGISLWVTDLIARIFGGFSLRQEDTRNSLSRSSLPVFMVHGTDDHFVPCYMTEQAFAVCLEPKEVLYVEGAGHGVSFLVDTESYTAQVFAFLKKYLEAPA